MTLSNDDDDEVSYMALARGTPVASSSDAAVCDPETAATQR